MNVTVWTYDVWGNAKDGWEVNDRSRIATLTGVRKKSFETDAGILRLAKAGGLLKSTVRLSQIVIDGDDTTAYIDAKKDGYPIGALYLEE